MDNPREHISAYIDGELDGDELRAFEDAMAKNDSLREEVDALREVDAMYVNHATSMPSQFTDDVMGKIQGDDILLSSVEIYSLNWKPILAFAACALVAVGIFATLQSTRYAEEPPMGLAMETAEDAPFLQSASNAAGSERLEVDTDEAGATVGLELRMDDALAEAEPEAVEEKAMENLGYIGAAPAPASPPPPAESMAEGIAGNARAADRPELSMANEPVTEQESFRDENMPELQSADPETTGARTRESAEPQAMRQAMADTRSAQAKATIGAVRTIGPHRLQLREEGWFEEGYQDEETEALLPATLVNIVEDAALRREFNALGQPVVFRVDDVWYRLAPTAP